MNATLDFSQITDQWYIAAWPTDRQVEIIKSLHVRLILCLFIERPGPALTLPPFQMLHLRTFDSPLASLPLRVI